MSFPINDGWYNIKFSHTKGFQPNLKQFKFFIFGSIPDEFIEIGKMSIGAANSSATLRRKPFRIEFEDHGQDFLFWDVDQKGVVTNCEPFQADIWVGKQITNFTSIQVDSHPQVKVDGVDMPIKYKIISMSLLNQPQS